MAVYRKRRRRDNSAVKYSIAFEELPISGVVGDEILIASQVYSDYYTKNQLMKTTAIVP